MERTLVGLGVIAVAMLSVLALTPFFAPSKTGAPIRSGSPAPPAVGACGVLAGTQFTSRDCGEPHTVEVVSSWRPGDPEDVPTFTSCTAGALDYVGSPPAQDARAHRLGQWSAPLRYRAVVTSGPRATIIPDWSWRLCLVVPIGPAPWQGYQGSVRAAPPTAPALSALRPCLADDDIAVAVVRCTTPHHGEIVATQRVTADAGSSGRPDNGVALASCRARAALLTGRADPTYDGALRVEVLPRPGTTWVTPLSADTGVFYTSDSAADWLLCVLSLAGQGRLVNSLAGVGSGPLPLQ